MANYDNIDLKWTWNGDFSLGSDKDIADTGSDALLSLRQDVHTIASSSIEDWIVYPNLGATLSDFVGEPNTAATAAAIHDRLKLALTSAGIVAESDLQITLVPVHIHKLLIIVRVRAAASAFNNLSTGELLTSFLVFDFMEQGITFYEAKPSLISEF